MRKTLVLVVAVIATVLLSGCGYQKLHHSSNLHT